MPTSSSLFYIDPSTIRPCRKWSLGLHATDESLTKDLIHSDYSAKVFGFASFGKVYGLIMCLGGLLNFSQYGFDALTHKTFRNNPIPVNVMLLIIALIVGIVLVGFIWRNGLAIRRELLEVEAEDAREVLMPAATDTL